MIRWETPPPRRNRDVYDWAAIGAELVARPGEWALVAVCPNSATAGQTAKHIRNGTYDALRGLGAFEATARTVDGEARVYARSVAS